jgi:conjugal transfer pilus assembly protein TraV
MSSPIPISAPVIATVLALTLTGCAGNPPRQATDAQSRQSTGVLDDLQAHQPKAKRGEQKATVTQDQQVTATMSARIAAPAKQPDPSPTQLPSRAPAQIMRIWIAPWEDAAGNLHGASHVFTEITPRRWQMASVPGTPAGTVLTPLQLEPRKAPAPDRHPKP